MWLHARPHLEHDLGMAAQGDRAGVTLPAAAVDEREHGRAARRVEPPKSPRGKRLSPKREQLSDRLRAGPRTLVDLDNPGRSGGAQRVRAAAALHEWPAPYLGGRDADTRRHCHPSVLREQLEFELNEYALWAENYPTEMQWPLEQARRLVRLKRYDEAIPLFQRARNDPKLKNQASLGLGTAFFEAGFYDEASEVIGALIDEYPAKGDDISKEMHYIRGRALEEMKDYDAALKLYSQLAQWDFGFRDVQQRIKKLRDAKRG